MRVLLIDDEPLARFVGRKALEKAGAFVTEAESLARAEEQWHAHTFDAVFCDHTLPDGKGVDLVARMRGQGHQETVFYLTAEKEEVSPSLQDQLELAGVLGKPLDMQELEKALAQVDGTAESGRERAFAGGSRVGAFEVIPLNADDAVAQIEQEREQYKGRVWIALDAGNRDELPEAVWPMIVAWAQECRAQGGRYCLLAHAPALRGHIHREGIDSEFDVAANRTELEALGRHLSSPVERRAVLDSVVIRDEP
jgi:CheY-like chemotaxis protein